MGPNSLWVPAKVNVAALTFAIVSTVQGPLRGSWFKKFYNFFYEQWPIAHHKKIYSSSMVKNNFSINFGSSAAKSQSLNFLDENFLLASDRAWRRRVSSKFPGALLRCAKKWRTTESEIAASERPHRRSHQHRCPPVGPFELTEIFLRWPDPKKVLRPRCKKFFWENFF